MARAPGGFGIDGARRRLAQGRKTSQIPCLAAYSLFSRTDPVAPNGEPARAVPTASELAVWWKTSPSVRRERLPGFGRPVGLRARRR